MAKLGYISHDQFPHDVCTAYTRVGENVGVGSGQVGPALQMLEAMMMAEGPCPHRGCPGTEFQMHGHYLNLVDSRYTRIGIGVYVQNGSVWLTEDFTAPPAPLRS
jgi:uncharacterized protein YkwD